MSQLLLVTTSEFDEILRLQDRCFDPWAENQINEERWIAGLSIILGAELVERMIGGGPYRIEVGEWLTR